MPNLLTIAILIMTLSLMATLRAQPMEMHISRPDAAACCLSLSLLPAGGSVQAYRGKLIIRTTAENLRSLQGVLGNLDAEPATVAVHLRRGSPTGKELTFEGTVSRNREGELDAQVQIEHSSPDSSSTTTTRYAPCPVIPHQSRYITGTVERRLRNPATALDQGIQVTPQSLPDGQVVLSIQQQHDTVSGNTAYTQHSATTCVHQANGTHGEHSLINPGSSEV